MAGSFDLDFEDIAITLNDGFPIGRFDGTAEIDQAGAILSLTFTHKPAFGVEQHRTLKVRPNGARLDTWDDQQNLFQSGVLDPNGARLDTWDDQLAYILADEIASQMKGDIEEALLAWRDDCRSGRECEAAQ